MVVRPLVAAIALAASLSLNAQENAQESAAREPFLVIAPARFADDLAPFVAARSEEGPTRLLVLEKVLAAGQGRDDAEKLKRRLFDEWLERRVRYVLLVGDVDVLPVRYMVLDRKTEPAFNYAFYPSDLYYADVARSDGSFDDWNAAAEGFHGDYFGEVRGEHNKNDTLNYDRIDYRPELAVGRWPVSTKAELARIVTKTLAHAGVERTEARAALIAVHGWVDARGRFDRIGERLGGRFSIERRYYKDDARNDGLLPPTRTVVEDLLIDGVDLVCHAGHGSPGGFEHSIDTKSLARLAQVTRPPLILSAACSTAYFATLPPYEPYVDTAGVTHRGTNAGEVFTAPPPPPAVYQRGAHDTTGLGERLVVGIDGGAVAYFGCNTGSQPCGLTLVEEFAGALADAEVRLGDAWAHAVARYFERERLAALRPTEGWYPPSVFFQGMKFMLFGDPTLAFGVSDDQVVTAPPPQTRVVPVRLELARGGSGEAGLLVDYVDRRYVLWRRGEVVTLPESEVTDVVFLDGRLGLLATPGEFGGEWRPVSELMRPLASGSRPAGAKMPVMGTVTLQPGQYHDFVSGGEGDRHVRLANDGFLQLETGMAGADFGHFIDLGEVDFDSVQRDGAFLKTPHRINSYPLFAWWRDPRPMILREEIEVQAGHVYLLRAYTGRWDGVVKLAVREVGATVTFDYAVLFEYDASAVRRRLDDAATEAAEIAGELRESGLRLYSRSRYRDYAKATLHCRLSTRDAPALTHNQWDLMVTESQGFLVLDAFGGDGSGIADLGERGDLPSPQSLDQDAMTLRDQTVAQVGHAYFVRVMRDNRAHIATVRVLEIVQGDSLVLTWRTE